ncbi:MAG: CAP domain-containing protein [Aggregatilineales bacterium]
MSTGSVLQAQDVTSELLGRVNALRASVGLPGYTLNGALTVAANNQAQWMVATGAVSHVQDNGSTPRSRAAAAGYPSSWVGENIYIGGRASVDSAMQFWTNSAIHYRGMTSNRYSEVGIGYAAGNSRAYVLVFGSPNGQVYVPPQAAANNTTNNNNNTGRASGGNGGTGNNAANAAPAAPPEQPPYVLGINEQGFIMHEVQSGDTVGDVAFLYGYGWDDISYILRENGMTENDVFGLEVGSTFLIPPYDGTFTPTPASPPSQSTQEAVDSSDDPPDDDTNSESNNIDTDKTQPELTITSTAMVLDIVSVPIENIATESTENNEADDETARDSAELPVLPAPVTYIPPTATATPSPSPTIQIMIRTLPPATPALVAALPTDTTVQFIPPDSTSTPQTDTPPVWLILAIVVQVGILLYAAIELLRRVCKQSPIL